jgi:hypothetical protein
VVFLLVAFAWYVRSVELAPIPTLTPPVQFQQQQQQQQHRTTPQQHEQEFMPHDAMPNMMSEDVTADAATDNNNNNEAADTASAEETSTSTSTGDAEEEEEEQQTKATGTETATEESGGEAVNVVVDQGNDADDDIAELETPDL